VLVLDGGRIALDGPVRTVLGDPRLGELGVAEPAAVRLPRMAAAAGVPSPRLAVLDAAVHAEASGA
jgi:hypothetical protein